VDDLLHHDYHDDNAVLSIVADVRASGAIDRAIAEARNYVLSSRAALMRLPDNEARQTMLAVADYVVARNH